MSRYKIITIAGIGGLLFLLLSIIGAVLFLQSGQSTDQPGEAATQQQQTQEDTKPPVKYGVLYARPWSLDGTYSEPKAKWYQDTVNANYSFIVTQNAKMQSLLNGSRTDYQWEKTDPFVDWAIANNKEVKFHTLVWHNDKINDPDTTALDWYDELPSDAERLVALEEFVRTVIEHYNGKVEYYDLINHFLFQEGDGNYMNTGKTIEEVMVLAFTWANEVSTDNTYIANGPTGHLTIKNNRDKLVKRVNDVNAQLPEGSKIDAVGVMGHYGWCGGEIPDTADIKAGLDDLHERTGLPIHITELDVTPGTEEDCGDELIVTDPFAPFTTSDGESYDSWFDYQDEAYSKLYDLFRNHEAITHISTWGFYDREFWRPYGGFFWGPNVPDYEDTTPKPAYSAIKDLTCSDLCSDRECGYDGCGGSCGTCTGNLVCDNQYKCSENQCTPDCDNKQCGDDGCGGSCGTCDNGKVCDNQQQCVEQQCTPNCDGKDCGDDGCGGSCGTCQDGYSCNNVFKCEEDPQECVPKCDVRECGNDGCGGSCGDCGSGYVCATDYTCAARPACTPQCDSRECGADGCGGSCGSCGSGYVCNSSYQCVVSQSQCTPSCTGKSCGSDGCGGYCGTCGSGYTCSSDFRCVVATVGGGGDVGKDGTKLPDTATGKEIAIIALGFGLLSTSIVLYTSGVVREKRSVRNKTFKKDF